MKRHEYACVLVFANHVSGRVQEKPFMAEPLAKRLDNRAKETPTSHYLCQDA
jgi:hypothetical protein